MTVKDASELFGLKNQTTVVRIQARYRKLMKKWHPDSCLSEDKDLCRQRSQQLNQAYHVLIHYCKNYPVSLSDSEKYETQLKDSDSQAEKFWKKHFSEDPLWN